MNKEEQFAPQSLSLFKMMSGTDVYKIPEYQRPYSWEDTQVEKLWDDIYESYQNYKDNCNRGEANVVRSYFLGSLIIVSKGKGIEEVVDGQQRLTTLTILLKVISEIYPNINATNGLIFSMPTKIKITTTKTFFTSLMLTIQ